MLSSPSQFYPITYFSLPPFPFPYLLFISYFCPFPSLPIPFNVLLFPSPSLAIYFSFPSHPISTFPFLTHPIPSPFLYSSLPFPFDLFDLIFPSFPIPSYLFPTIPSLLFISFLFPFLPILFISFRFPFLSLCCSFLSHPIPSLSYPFLRSHPIPSLNYPFFPIPPPVSLRSPAASTSLYRFLRQRLSLLECSDSAECLHGKWRARACSKLPTCTHPPQHPVRPPVRLSVRSSIPLPECLSVSLLPSCSPAPLRSVSATSMEWLLFGRVGQTTVVQCFIRCQNNEQYKLFITAGAGRHVASILAGVSGGPAQCRPHGDSATLGEHTNKHTHWPTR